MEAPSSQSPGVGTINLWMLALTGWVCSILGLLPYLHTPPNVFGPPCLPTLPGFGAVAWSGGGSIGMTAALGAPALTDSELPVEVVALTDAGS